VLDGGEWSAHLSVGTLVLYCFKLLRVGENVALPLSFGENCMSVATGITFLEKLLQCAGPSLHLSGVRCL
jgi:hypothetical protein